MLIKRTASWAAKLVLTAGAFWYLLLKVDIGAAWQAGRHLSPLLFGAAILLQVLQVSICGLRWQLVLRAIGARLPFFQACELFSIGNFFGQVLPGAIGGDAVRIVATRRTGLGLATSINSVMLERVATVYALVLLTTAGEPLLADRLAGSPGLWLFPALTVAATAGIIALMLLDLLPASLRRWRMVRGVAQVAADTRRLFLRPSRALPTMAVAILGHVNLSVLAWTLAVGLAAPVSLLDCLVLVPPVVLVATLPISVAGWGAREVAMITVFGLIGVPVAQATALSVLFGLSGLLIALPGGFFWLLWKKPLEGGEIPG